MKLMNRSPQTVATYRNAFFHVTPRPAVVLTDNYCAEQELLRHSGLESKNAGVKQTTQC